MLNANNNAVTIALANVSATDIQKAARIIEKNWSHNIPSAEDKCRLLVWRLAYTYCTYVGEGLGRALDGLSAIHFECLAAMDLGMLARHTAAVTKVCRESGMDGHIALSGCARECWIVLLSDLVGGNE